MMKDRKLTKYELDNIKKAKLQEKALDISLGVGVLSDAIANGNKKIKECLDKVASGEFEKGKVTITVEITTQELEAQNVINQATNSVESRTYISPVITHKESLSMTYKSESGESIDLPDMELIEIGGEYIAVPLEDAQVLLDDYMQEKL